jgi:radical SAM superfamily enzyme YgiQ (UPF0313 family)
MARILLISANTCTHPDPVFPLGLALLTAALHRAGHEVRWHDVLVSDRDLPAVLAEFQPHLAGISLRNIDDVLIRKRETFYPAAARMVEDIRAAGCVSVLGGSGFSIFPQELMACTGADYGIVGAGEDALVELAGAVQHRRSPAGIPGLLSRQESGVAANPPSGVTAWPEVDDDARVPEITAWYLKSGGMLNLQTQRGCALRCCYCTYPLIEGRLHRRADAEWVAEEFARAARLGARYVFIVDSVFNSSTRHATEICEALLRRSIKISWGCFLRPHGLTRELTQLMARAGLAHAEFGSDSFSDPVLEAYDKAFTFEDVLHSSRCAREAGIDYCHFLIAGGPGETPATLQEGFRNSQELPSPVIMAVVGTRIYPGTAVHRRALAEGLITPETNLLEPRYYLSPALSEDQVFENLHRFSKENPAWIAGDPGPGYSRLVERLRARGTVGPLWSYFAMLQRLWPSAPVPSSSPS